MDLIEFLETRLAEDEAIARAATRGPWKWDDYRVRTLYGRAGEVGEYEWDTEVIEASHEGECACRSLCTLELTVSAPDADHVARHDPARVLREVAAMRDILGCIKLLDEKLEAENRYPLTSYTYGVLESLADIWSDHPDYESWISD